MKRIAEVRGATFARKRLLARRERLAGLAEGLRRAEDELQKGSRPDNLDRAADLEPHDVLEELQAAEARELAEIDAALHRLEAGSYGACERCGQPIGALRLRAVPEAPWCMACSGAQ